MPRAVFMGSDLFSVPILEMLLTRGPDLSPSVVTVAVVTQPDRPAGRGRRTSANPVKTLAERHAVQTLQPERIRAPEALTSIGRLEPDVIVVASYGQLLPKVLLDMPPHHCLNLHPSLLPCYRGPSPIAAPILAGEERSGTTLMLMSPKMDAGPILAQEEISIGACETAGELESRLARLSAELLARHLPGWLNGALAPRPQDELLATYTSRISKEDGRIDWSLPAYYLARQVRAFNPWPAAYTFWEERQLRLLRARSEPGQAGPGEVLAMQDGALACGTGQCLLLVDELQLAGGKPLAAADLIRGHPELLRAHFS